MCSADQVTDLFNDLSVVQEINQELHDTLPFHYNYSLTGGYFNMPSARMLMAGTTAASYAYIPPYRRSSFAMQIFNRLHIGVNYTAYHGIADCIMGSQGFGDFADRGADFKFAVLQKGDGYSEFPEISIGVDDFYGTQRFHSKYIVATKEWLPIHLETSVGWGTGRLDGFFAGASWTPLRRCSILGLNTLTMTAEWDANDYEKYLWEHPLGRELSSRVNIGISMSLYDVLAVNVSSIRGKEIAASASFSYNIGGSKGLFPKIEDPPFYNSPVNTHPIGDLRAESAFSCELVLALSEQGLDVYKLYVTADKGYGRSLWLTIINLRYLNEADVKQRIQDVLVALTPSNIHTVTVNIEADGIPTQEYCFQTTALKDFQQGKIDNFELNVLSPMKDPSSPLSVYDSTLLYRRNKPVWEFTVRPRWIMFFGGAGGKLKYSAGIQAGPDGYICNQVYYNIQCGYNIYSQMSGVGDYDVINPSTLLNVQTDRVNYFRSHSVFLDRAYLQKGWYIHKGWYSRLSAGYFDCAYGGVAAEALYYPVGSSWAFGFSGASVLKRNYTGLGFTTSIRQWEYGVAKYRHFIGFQYFFDTYYNYEPLNLDVKVRIGKFLARDVGARIELSRYYPSGARFGLWYTLTSAQDFVNGKRYHDKGVAFTIPFDVFLQKSSRTCIPYSLSVWLRDSGVSAHTGKELFPTLQQERAQFPINTISR